MNRVRLNPPRYLKWVLFAAFVLLVFDFSGILRFREQDSYDLRLKIRAPQTSHQDLVVVLIDDESIDQIGEWPWPRSIHGRAIEKLNEYGAKAIFYDVLFPKPSRNPQNDQDLANAIKEAGNVVFPFHYQIKDKITAVFPIDKFRKNLREMGYANLDIDSDSVVRRITGFKKLNGQVVYHSSVAVILATLEERETLPWIEQFNKKTGGSFLINYPGDIHSFHSISFKDLLDDDQSKESKMELLFKNKVVLIGDMRTGSSDIRPSPMMPFMPGVFIQASALHTLISGNYLIPVTRLWSYLVVLLVCLITGIITQRVRPGFGLIFVPLTMIVYAVFNHFIFHWWGRVLPLVLPLVGMGQSYIITLVLKVMETKVQADFLHRELETASKIQESLLPAQLLKNDMVEASFRCEFFEQVGGDLYDWVMFSEDVAMVIIGDVSGKGIPASLYMSRVLTELRRERSPEFKPAQLLEKINQVLWSRKTAGIFLTLAVMIVDRKNRKVYAANAGHENIFRYNAYAGKVEKIEEPKGVPLGVMEYASYENLELDYQEGDSYFLWSDGLREQKNRHDQRYGEYRLMRLIQGLDVTHEASELIESVFEDVKEFSENVQPHDDRTLICVKIL